VLQVLKCVFQNETTDISIETAAQILQVSSHVHTIFMDSCVGRCVVSLSVGCGHASHAQKQLDRQRSSCEWLPRHASVVKAIHLVPMARYTSHSSACIMACNNLGGGIMRSLETGLGRGRSLKLYEFKAGVPLPPDLVGALGYVDPCSISMGGEIRAMSASSAACMAQAWSSLRPCTRLSRLVLKVTDMYTGTLPLPLVMAQQLQHLTKLTSLDLVGVDVGRDYDVGSCLPTSRQELRLHFGYRRECMTVDLRPLCGLQRMSVIAGKEGLRTSLPCGLTRLDNGHAGVYIENLGSAALVRVAVYHDSMGGCCAKLRQLATVSTLRELYMGCDDSRDGVWDPWCLPNMSHGVLGEPAQQPLDSGLLSALSSCTSVTRLVLVTILEELWADAPLSWCSALAGLKSLQSLVIECCCDGFDSAERVPSLSELTALTALTMLVIDIKQAGAVDMMDLLRDLPGGQMQLLQVNCLDLVIGTELLGCISRLTSLTSLSMYCRTRDYGCNVVQALAPLSRLQRLYLAADDDYDDDDDGGGGAE
jgi:hypothetical protein